MKSVTPYLPNKTRNLKPSVVFTWAHVEIVWKWNIPWSYFPSKLKTAKRFPALIRHIFVNRASFVHSSKANGMWKTKWCRKITYVSLSLAATMISQGLLNKTYRSVWLFFYIYFLWLSLVGVKKFVLPPVPRSCYLEFKNNQTRESRPTQHFNGLLWNSFAVASTRRGCWRAWPR